MSKKFLSLFLCILLFTVSVVVAPNEMTVDQFQALDPNIRAKAYDSLGSPTGEFFDLLLPDEQTSDRLLKVGADEQTEVRINALSGDEKPKFLANPRVVFAEGSAARKVAGEYLDGRTVTSNDDKEILKKYLESFGSNEESITLNIDNMPEGVIFEQGEGENPGTIKVGTITLDVKPGMELSFDKGVNGINVKTSDEFVIKHGDKEYTITPTEGSEFNGKFAHNPQVFNFEALGKYNVETNSERFPKIRVNNDAESYMSFSDIGELQHLTGQQIVIDVNQGIGSLNLKEYKPRIYVGYDENGQGVRGVFRKTEESSFMDYDLMNGAYSLIGSVTGGTFQRVQYWVGEGKHDETTPIFSGLKFSESNLVTARRYSGEGKGLDVLALEDGGTLTITPSTTVTSAQGEANKRTTSRSFEADYNGIIIDDASSLDGIDQNEVSEKEFMEDNGITSLTLKLGFNDERHINLNGAGNSNIAYNENGITANVGFNAINGAGNNAVFDTSVNFSVNPEGQRTFSISRNVAGVDQYFNQDNVMSVTYYRKSPDGRNYQQVTEKMSFENGKMVVTKPVLGTIQEGQNIVVADSVVSEYNQDGKNVIKIETVIGEDGRQYLLVTKGEVELNRVELFKEEVIEVQLSSSAESVAEPASAEPAAAEPVAEEERPILTYYVVNSGTLF